MEVSRVDYVREVIISLAIQVNRQFRFFIEVIYDWVVQFVSKLIDYMVASGKDRLLSIDNCVMALWVVVIVLLRVVLRGSIIKCRECIIVRVRKYIVEVFVERFSKVCYKVVVVFFVSIVSQVDVCIGWIYYIVFEISRNIVEERMVVWACISKVVVRRFELEVLVMYVVDILGEDIFKCINKALRQFLVYCKVEFYDLWQFEIFCEKVDLFGRIRIVCIYLQDWSIIVFEVNRLMLNIRDKVNIIVFNIIDIQIVVVECIIWLYQRDMGSKDINIIVNLCFIFFGWVLVEVEMRCKCKLCVDKGFSLSIMEVIVLSFDQWNGFVVEL